jgi:hypothetical protein
MAEDEDKTLERNTFLFQNKIVSFEKNAQESLMAAFRRINKPRKENDGNNYRLRLRLSPCLSQVSFWCL